MSRHTRPGRVRRLHLAVLVQAFVLLTAARPVLGAQEPALLERLEAGDYVWSLDFPRRDARLLAYGTEFLRTLRGHCPQYRPRPEEEHFTAAWVLSGLIADGSPSVGLQQTVRTALDEPTVRAGARDDALHVTSLAGCSSAMVRQLEANASRLVAGERPAHGTAVTGDLLEEKVSPLATRHLSDASIDSLGGNPRLLEVIERTAAELRSVGFRILECHYDRDPSDGTYEVQYYWSPGAATLTQVTTLLPRIVRRAQQQLETAAGRPARHPFRDYGSARTQCPARYDAAMPTKTIYTPEYEAGGWIVALHGTWVGRVQRGLVDPPTRIELTLGAGSDGQGATIKEGDQPARPAFISLWQPPDRQTTFGNRGAPIAFGVTYRESPVRHLDGNLPGDRPAGWPVTLYPEADWEAAQAEADALRARAAGTGLWETLLGAWVAKPVIDGRTYEVRVGFRVHEWEGTTRPAASVTIGAPEVTYQPLIQAGLTGKVRQGTQEVDFGGPDVVSECTIQAELSEDGRELTVTLHGTHWTEIPDCHANGRWREHGGAPFSLPITLRLTKRR